jgi:hypothetical protein
MDIPIMGAPGEHITGERSAGEHSAGELSAGEHSAGEHSAGERSAGEPSWNVGRGFPTIKAVLMFRNNLFTKQISLLDLWTEDNVQSSVPDPCHFGVDPDPRILASD